MSRRGRGEPSTVASTRGRPRDPAAVRRAKIDALLASASDGKRKNTKASKPQSSSAASAGGSFKFRSVDSWASKSEKSSSSSERAMGRSSSTRRLPASVQQMLDQHRAEQDAFRITANDSNNGERQFVESNNMRHEEKKQQLFASLSDEEEEKPAKQQPQQHESSGVPSLLDLSARAIGENYHLIPGIGETFLPPGTLIRALENICRAGLLSDAHVDLFYATLPAEQDTRFLFESNYARAGMDKELELVRNVTDSSVIFTRNHQSAHLTTLYVSPGRMGERVTSALKDRYQGYDPLRPTHHLEREKEEEKWRTARDEELVRASQVLPFLLDYTTRELGRHCFRVDLQGQRGITETGFEELAACISEASFKHIVHANLSFCESLTNKALAAFARACGKHLLKLDITGCQRISNAGIKALTEACPAIENISYELCHRIDDRALQDTVHNLPRLSSINLGSCKKLSNVGFQIVSAHGKSLKHINANGSAQLTDLGLEDLSKCINVCSLSLRSCRRITDAGVLQVVKLCMRQRKRVSISLEEGTLPVLKHLDIGGCARITDKAVVALAAKSDLEYLDLRGLSKLTDAILPVLATNLPKLKYVNLACCEGLSPEKIAQLRASRPSLSVDYIVD